jgi:hypothetical protein
LTAQTAAPPTGLGLTDQFGQVEISNTTGTVVFN